MKVFRCPQLVAAFALAQVALSGAADINWSNSSGSTNYTSAGAPNLIGGGFFFELGAFADDFEPSTGNVSEWADHWVALDRDVYNPTTRFFTSKASLTSNDPPFVPSERPYIWGFNLENPGEWILVTNPGWFWPFAGGVQPPFTWSIGQAGCTTVVGQVNGSGFQMMTEEINEGPPPVDPEAWRQQHFTRVERANPTISDWGADPDNDGASNLFELAAGTNPRDATGTPDLTVRLIDLGSGARSLELVLNRSQRASLDHSAESSADLSAWSSTGLTVESDTRLELVLRFAPSGNRRFARMTFNIPAS